MKCLARNKQTFYYSLYVSKTELVDEYGNKSGEYDIQYTTPTECKANISPAQGETETRQFGNDVKYDKVIVLENSRIEIDEHSILWIDRLPNEENTIPHDYVVRGIARSLNSVSLAVEKVDIR
jgi:hypothetical protein